MDEKKSRALMQVIERIIVRHHQGLVSLDEPSFELFELAKRIRRAKDEKEFQDAMRKLAAFVK